MGSYREPAGKGAFFIDEPVEVEIVGDIVRMRFVSAGQVLETRCSIHSMLVGIERCKREHAKWEREQAARVRSMREQSAEH